MGRVVVEQQRPQYRRQWSDASTWDWGEEEGSDWDEDAERRNSDLYQPPALMSDISSSSISSQGESTGQGNGKTSASRTKRQHQHRHQHQEADGDDINNSANMDRNQRHKQKKDHNSHGTVRDLSNNNSNNTRVFVSQRWRFRIPRCACAIPVFFRRQSSPGLLSNGAPGTRRRWLCRNSTWLNLRAQPRIASNGAGFGVGGGGGRGAGVGVISGGVGSGRGSWWSAVKEVRDFLIWMAFILAFLAQIPLIWYCFWQYVCPKVGNSDQERHHVGKAMLPLWLLWLFGVHSLRRQLMGRAQPPIAWIIRNGEIFICVSILMTICANFCTLVHRPRPPLFDVGFYLIPAQARDSRWRPLSDILTVALPGLAFFRSLFLERRLRCRLVADWLRLMSVTYLMRCLCVTLTSLPGPAPHCESYAAYSPPLGWHDVATRLGPLVGDFGTCGDLVFSGHTAWTTTTMLLLAKSFRRAPVAVYRFVKLSGIVYLLTMCTCTIAGRKHYTVDVALGIVIAGLTFFRFQDGLSPRRHPSGGETSNNALQPGQVHPPHLRPPRTHKRKLTADSPLLPETLANGESGISSSSGDIEDSGAGVGSLLADEGIFIRGGGGGGATGGRSGRGGAGARESVRGGTVVSRNNASSPRPVSWPGNHPDRWSLSIGGDCNSGGGGGGSGALHGGGTQGNVSGGGVGTDGGESVDSATTDSRTSGLASASGGLFIV